MEHQELLDKAIVKVRYKIFPQLVPRDETESIYVSQEAYRSIFDILEVWGNEQEDFDAKEKTEYIYNRLKELGKPKELLISIVSMLGITPLGETKLNRIYRYIKLNKEVGKISKYQEHLKKEIDAIGYHRRK